MTASSVAHPLARALSLTALVCACEHETPAVRRRYVLPPEVDAGPVDASVSGRLCALRATPPGTLSVGANPSRAAVAWSGTAFGVAWLERPNDAAVVMFARASTAGTRVGAAVRVSEAGFRAGPPTLAWNGVNWSVIFEGGFARASGDLYQARVDARGNAVGSPWRMTRGPREDGDPVFVSTGQGFGLAWVAREDYDRTRSVLYAQVLNRWDAPVGPPTALFNTSLTLASPGLVWTGQAWAVTCVSFQREARAVDLFRMEPNGAPRGGLLHATPERIGGVDVERRYAVAWDGAAFGVAWSELRDGATRVFFRRLSPRGNPLGDDREVSAGAASASEPALVAVAPGVFAAAMRVERDGFSRVWVRTVDASGVAQGGHVELQGADGQAASPAAVFDGSGVGVATVTPRGVSFHRVAVGPCIAP